MKKKILSALFAADLFVMFGMVGNMEVKNLPLSAWLWLVPLMAFAFADFALTAREGRKS